MGKILFLTAVLLFGAIGIAAYLKSDSKSEEITYTKVLTTPQEIELDQVVVQTAPPTKIVTQDKASIAEVDRIQEFFNKKDPRFPIVETISYKSRTPWQKGRPAWISDYASYYETSRHFIARSLNGKADYLKQEVGEGDKFNVLKKDKNVNFHLLIDASRAKMGFYYIDLDTKQRVLIKTYNVGLGRPDSTKVSGLLTPLGKYSLGDKIAIYKPGIMGYHNGKKIEMIRTFGTRWIPFENEIANATAPAKGLGIHGVPWVEKNGEIYQDVTSLNKYESDGCIRLASEDIEEIFAIVITKPTFVEIVRDFNEAKLPGEEIK